MSTQGLIDLIQNEARGEKVEKDIKYCNRCGKGVQPIASLEGVPMCPHCGLWFGGFEPIISKF